MISWDYDVFDLWMSDKFDLREKHCEKTSTELINTDQNTDAAGLKNISYATRQNSYWNWFNFNVIF